MIFQQSVTEFHDFVPQRTQLHCSILLLAYINLRGVGNKRPVKLSQQTHLGKRMETSFDDQASLY